MSSGEHSPFHIFGDSYIRYDEAIIKKKKTVNERLIDIPNPLLLKETDFLVSLFNQVSSPMFIIRCIISTR